MTALQKLLDQTFLVEVATAYRLSIYEGKEEAKRFLEEFDRDFSSIPERQYWDFYRATAINIAKSLSHIEDRYRRGRDHIDDHRKYDEERLKAIKAQRIEYSDAVADALNRYGILGRLSPALGSLIISKFLKSANILPQIEWLPETIATIAFGVSHIAIKTIGKYQITNIEDWYNKSMNEVIETYAKKSVTLEKWADDKKRWAYERGEKKIIKAYEKYFGVKVDDDRPTWKSFDDSKDPPLLFL